MADRVLIDTGPIVAILDSRDQHHKACVSQASHLPDKVYTCWPVLTEACYLVRKRRDLVEALLETLRDGTFELLKIEAHEVSEIGGLLAKYADQQIDLADACLAYLAERERISTVFTVDVQHFSLFRDLTGRPLTLLPEP